MRTTKKKPSAMTSTPSNMIDQTLTIEDYFAHLELRENLCLFSIWYKEKLKKEHKAVLDEETGELDITEELNEVQMNGKLIEKNFKAWCAYCRKYDYLVKLGPYGDRKVLLKYPFKTKTNNPKN